MSKENKTLLKTLLSNQELIMKHLGITVKAPEKSKKTVKTPENKATTKTESIKKAKSDANKQTTKK